MSDLTPVYVNWQDSSEKASTAWVGNYRLSAGSSVYTKWCWHVDLIWPDNHISFMAEGRDCLTMDNAKRAAQQAFARAMHGPPTFLKNPHMDVVLSSDAFERIEGHTHTGRKVTDSPQA